MRIEKFDAPAEIEQFHSDRPISHLMLLIWQSRKDLQHAFDLQTKAGQQGYIAWYDVSIRQKYGITPPNEPASAKGSSNRNAGQGNQPSAPPLYSRLIRLESRLSRASRWLPVRVRDKAKNAWLRLMVTAAHAAAGSAQTQERRVQRDETKPAPPELQQYEGDPGVNLIGYAHAEAGMGEHVRMSAAALTETNVPFGVVNFDVATPSRQKALLSHGSLSNSNKYKTNIFHVNADQMLLCYCHLGRTFFEGNYNIGYWAWELARCPEQWVPVFDLVDEIWAPSRFIQNAFAEKANLPVVHMPLCVNLPPIAQHSRRQFGLPSNTFLFLFTFDFFSYIERKNPFAVIQAFKCGFDGSRKDVGLVIKVMNGDEKNVNWRKMLGLIDGDPRIFVLNRTMDRMEMLGLFDVCNCFVSLHRSEGFGRGPAEAMYLGKPVIVTNYSGNTDFTLSDNSCLVDYQLVPVKEEQYLFDKGQVWADPDIYHAAWFMKKLVADSDYCRRIGRSGSVHIRTNYSQSAIGDKYRRRLVELGLV